MTRLRGSVLVAALVALVLSGCSSIPMSGPVQTVAPQQQDDDDRAAFVPNGPTDGMSPEEVVSGFVLAQGAGGDYAVAKEFLTEGFARAWRPDASVLVHQAQWSVEQQGGGHVRLQVPTVARLDADGLYTPTSQQESKGYDLQRVRGQWRISGGADGVVLSARTFTTVFASVQLKFFDLDHRRLVPDLRWFPAPDGARDSDDGAVSVAATAPEVVRAVLGGASPVLQGVTDPVFPAGTVLAAPVRTSAGTTTVSIRVPGTALSEQTTNRIQQALAAVFPTTSTASFRLVVNGVEAPVAPPPDLEQPSISDPVVATVNRFGTVTAQGTVQEDRELGPGIVKLKPRAVTVSAQRRLAAVLTGGGQVDVVTGKETLIADDRPGLIAPTLDQEGWSYSIPEDDPSGLRVTDADGKRHGVDADLGTDIVSIEVSSDGTRLLVLDRTASGPEAYVAAILRDTDGQPIGLSADRYPVPLGSADARDATWVDQVSVAVLTETSSVQSVTLQQLGGIATGLGTLSNAESIVGGSTRLDLRALLGTGQILRLSTSNAWAQEFPAGVDARVLAVQR